MSEPRKKRKLKVDLGDLALSFESSFPEMSSYLDLETGQVVDVTPDLREELAVAAREARETGGDERQALLEVLAQQHLPEWVADAALDVDWVEPGFGDRYIAVPTVESSEAYRDMEDFVDTVEDSRAQRHLAGALGSRRPFRAFKDALIDYPEVRQRWFAFSNDCMRARVLQWLEQEGIEPITE